MGRNLIRFQTDQRSQYTAVQKKKDIRDLLLTFLSFWHPWSRNFLDGFGWSSYNNTEADKHEKKFKLDQFA